MAMAPPTDHVVGPARGADLLIPVDPPSGSQLSAGSERVTARVIRTPGDWNAIGADWDALFAASPQASPPLDFAWLQGWWRNYGPAYGTGLRIVTVWRGTRLVGALPLYEDRPGGSALGIRRLRLLSTGEAEFEETCADYLNALCLPGEEKACLEAMRDCLQRLDWDQLELFALPEESPLLLDGALPGHARTFLDGICPVADLAGGFEAYLGRLSANGRQQARRLVREGERAGAAFEIVPTSDAVDAFDDLVRLHQLRWNAEGQPGVFAAPRFAAFHRDIAREWLPGGGAILARLSLDGQSIAMLYGFITGSRFAFYQSGVRLDGAAPLRSPGNLAHLLLMRLLAEKGVTAYDFLRGVSDYKARLATRENRLVAVQVWRPTLRAATRRSVRLAAQVTRRGLRLLPQGEADK